jgi:valyl-tRNA synthetase
MWHFFWNDFCDWYIELKKQRFQEASGLDAHWSNILNVFENALRLLHPSMPFLTEELWQRLNPGEGRSISVAEFPQFDPALADSAAEDEMERVQEVLIAARQIRSEANVPRKTPLKLRLAGPAAYLETTRRNADAMQRLDNVDFELVENREAAFALSIAEAVNGTAPVSSARSEREIEQLEKNIANSRRQLADEKFLLRAPAHIVDGIRSKLAEYESRLESLRR